MYSDPLLKKYLDEIRKIPLLTFEQEIELSAKSLEGDIEARNRLVQSNLRFVVSIAKKYINKMNNPTLLDLINLGNLGLMRAAEKYDGQKYGGEVKFITYAVYWINQSICRNFRDYNEVKFPTKISSIINSVYKRLSFGDSLEKISEDIEYPVEFIQELIALSKTNSLDSLLENRENLMEMDLSIEGKLLSDERYSPNHINDNFMKKELLSILEKKLSKSEKDIILSRFGFFGTISSLRDLGMKYNITQEGIRQIELKAIRKLKNNSQLLDLFQSYFS